MRNTKTQFQPGHSGGRPKGARNRLAAQVFEDILRHWCEPVEPGSDRLGLDLRPAPCSRSAAASALAASRAFLADCGSAAAAARTLLLGVAFIDAALLDVLRNIDFKPLDRFQAEHLEYLVLLLCYWRELEDGGHGGDGPNKKPLVKGPDPLQ